MRFPASSLVALGLTLAAPACAPQGDELGGQGTWQSMSTVGAPAPRVGHTALWTGAEMVVWGGIHPQDGTRHGDGARYQPASDSWIAMSTDGAPSARVGHRAVTYAGEVLVWGGVAEGPSGVDVTATGGRYDLMTDSWTPIATAGAPAARTAHLSVWTGSEMIVWGGADLGGGAMIGGALYDPATDTWRPMSTVGAPAPASGFAAVWTGSEMIVWGLDVQQGVPAGARYSPASDSWGSMDEEGAPTLSFPCALWTGFELIVWGSEVEGIGARYNPVANLWSVTTRFPEAGGEVAWSCVWTDRELIVWGGYRRDGSTLTPLATGVRYEPSFLAAYNVAQSGAPPARANHTAVWTGDEMIIWGGSEDAGPTGTGARYSPPP